MSPYHHLTLSQREVILIGTKTNKKVGDIAKEADCSKATVYREIARNGGRTEYSAAQAQDRYTEQRTHSHRQRLLAQDGQLRAMIIEYIVEFQWSPEQIAGRLAYETGEKKISFPTIYRGIALDNLGVPLTSHGARGIARQLRHHGKTRRVKGTVNERRGKFHGVRAITERPAGAQNRTRFGHWEGDTVRGKTGGAAVVTLVDCKARYLLLGKVAKATADNVRDCLLDLLSTVPTQRRRSLTPDRGKEFARYKDVEKELGIPVFFPDPHAPYQRGTNENTNGLIREYFSKNTPLEALSETDLETIIDSLNNRPRKVLGWRTPTEVFFNQSRT